MSNRGACYIVYGEAARKEAALSIQSLQLSNDLPVTVIGEAVDSLPCIPFERIDKGGRWAKVNLDSLSPYQHTLYIDADTRVHGNLSAGFDILANGFDLAITPSTNQSSSDWLWHVDEVERDYTRLELGFAGLVLQAGVMFIARNERTRQLFGHWRSEWMRWKGQDQAALLRALAAVPVKVWLLGRPYNGGSIVDHRFGAIRRR